MGVRHSGLIHARCPVNGEWDYYEVVAEHETHFIGVEAFVAKLNEWRGEMAYQEDICEDIARGLGCKITMRGRHGVIDTTAEKLGVKVPEG